jgi:hypothetical protein
MQWQETFSSSWRRIWMSLAVLENNLNENALRCIGHHFREWCRLDDTAARLHLHFSVMTTPSYLVTIKSWSKVRRLVWNWAMSKVKLALLLCWWLEWMNPSCKLWYCYSSVYTTPQGEGLRGPFFSCLFLGVSMCRCVDLYRFFHLLNATKTCLSP